VLTLSSEFSRFVCCSTDGGSKLLGLSVGLGAFVIALIVVAAILLAVLAICYLKKRNSGNGTGGASKVVNVASTNGAVTEPLQPQPLPAASLTTDLEMGALLLAQAPPPPQSQEGAVGIVVFHELPASQQQHPAALAQPVAMLQPSAIATGSAATYAAPATAAAPLPFVHVQFTPDLFAAPPATAVVSTTQQPLTLAPAAAPASLAVASSLLIAGSPAAPLSGAARLPPLQAAPAAPAGAGIAVAVTTPQ
jgi:hypothetical protein